MTDLGLALKDYLRLRESLGYKVVQPGRSLRQFVAYLEKVGLDHVTTEATVAWATQPQGVRSGEWARRFGLARGFAGYLRTIDPATEGPPAGFVAGKNRRATPYLYSDCEVAALMAVARRLSSPMRAATYECLIGLLAVGGLRVSEAIALDRDDVDLTSGILTIRAAKFGKTRQVLVHPSTMEALATYARRRDQLVPAARALRSSSPQPGPGSSTAPSTSCSASWCARPGSGPDRRRVAPGRTTCAIRWTAGLCALPGCFAWWGPRR